MDLGLFARVLWRFRYFVASGFLIAVLLAVLAVAHVTFSGGVPKLTYRKGEIWSSQAQLLITKQGFPYGQLNDTGTGGLSNLVGLYTTFVNSDAVQSQLNLPPGVLVRGQTVVDTSVYGSSTPLPVLGIVGYAASPIAAQQAANRGSVVFKHFIDKQQQAAAIPLNQRVVLQRMNVASAAGLVQGRKKTLPILAFMTVMLATIGLTFVLENLRPQVRVQAPKNDVEPELLQKSA